MNKNGQSFSIILFLLVGIVSVFMIYLLAVPMAHIWDNLSSELKGEDAFGSDNKTVQVLNQVDSLVTPAFDQAVFIGMIAIILGVLIMALFFSDHPVFVIFMIISVVLVMIIGSQLVNVADTAVNDPLLDGKADEFTLGGIIFGNQFPIIILIIGITASIIMLTRNRGAPA